MSVRVVCVLPLLERVECEECDDDEPWLPLDFAWAVPSARTPASAAAATAR